MNILEVMGGMILGVLFVSFIMGATKRYVNTWSKEKINVWGDFLTGNKTK